MNLQYFSDMHFFYECLLSKEKLYYILNTYKWYIELNMLIQIRAFKMCTFKSM